MASSKSGDDWGFDENAPESGSAPVEPARVPRPTSAAWFRLAVVGTVLLMAAWIAVVALLSWWVITRLLG
jgi:hypothetical protein